MKFFIEFNSAGNIHTASVNCSFKAGLSLSRILMASGRATRFLVLGKHDLRPQWILVWECYDGVVALHYDLISHFASR